MKLVERSGKLIVFENDIEIFRFSQWQRGKKKVTGKLEKFSGKEKSMLALLKDLKRLIEEEYSVRKLELNLGKYHFDDQRFEDIAICNRGVMQLNLNKYEPDNRISKTLGDHKTLELTTLKNHINDIFNGTPEFDKTYMGVKNPKELYEVYERAILEEEFGTLNPELSFELINPFRGFVISIDLMDKKNNFLIGDLLVLPEHRNKGLGTALIKRVLNGGKKEGYSKTMLAVTLENPALKIYKKLGFRFIARTTLLLVNN
ncbi:MAG: GNAT family N-acetyltransferase [Kosmotoga sp.]|nr:MAG: GNAT family N-acetyltransferase [Kosmotoga sp.]